MKETPRKYIYLSIEDKIKLTKQAQAKMLSLSSYVNIIAKNYLVFVSNEEMTTKYKKEYDKFYFFKGECRIKIKPRNENKQNYTDLTLTNCCYLFLHNDKAAEIYGVKLNFTKINRKIQSESDKTLDNNWNLNQVIRTNYIAQRKLRA